MSAIKASFATLKPPWVPNTALAVLNLVYSAPKEAVGLEQNIEEPIAHQSCLRYRKNTVSFL